MLKLAFEISKKMLPAHITLNPRRRRIRHTHQNHRVTIVRLTAAQQMREGQTTIGRKPNVDRRAGNRSRGGPRHVPGHRMWPIAGPGDGGIGDR